MKRSIKQYFAVFMSLNLLTYIPISVNAQTAQSSIAGTYSCQYLIYDLMPPIPLPAPSPLGTIQLDGRGRYSSDNFGTGNYVFDASKKTVSFIDGKMANAVAAYSINEKGNPEISFEPKLNTRIKFDQSHYCSKDSN